MSERTTAAAEPLVDGQTFDEFVEARTKHMDHETASEIARIKFFGIYGDTPIENGYRLPLVTGAKASRAALAAAGGIPLEDEPGDEESG